MGFLGGLLGRGGRTEQVVGRIVFDHSDIEKATTASEKLGRTLTDVGRKISLYAGGFAAAGLAAAQHVNQINTQYRVLLGSQEKATRQLAQIRDLARRANQPYLELAQSAAGFLNTIQGTNAQLDTMLSISQRLRVVDPTARAFDVAIAMREFASGEARSLASRFEIPRNVVRDILAEANGDVQRSLELLSDYLDSIGVTQEALEEMGAAGVNAFSVLRSEVTEALSMAFTPILQDIVIPAVQAFGDWLRQLRETNPELLRMVGVGASLVAALGPVLVILGQIANAIGTIGRIAPRAFSAIGRGVVAAGALAAGAEIGTTVAGAITGQSREEVAENVVDTFVQALGIAVVAATELRGIIEVLFADLNVFANEIIAVFERGLVNLGLMEDPYAESVAEQVAAMEALNEQVFSGAISIEEYSAAMAEIGEVYGDRAAEARGHAEQVRRDAVANVEAARRTAAQLWQMREAVEETGEAVEETAVVIENAVGQGLTDARTQVTDFTDEMLTEFGQYQDDMTSIQDDAQEQRKESARQYEQRRAETIAAFGQRLKRMAVDEGRAMLQRQRQLAKSIDGIRGNLAKREIELIAQAAGTDQKAQQAIKKHRAQQQEDLRNHLDKIERMEEDHRDKLRGSARQLDAIAVIAELERFDKSLDREQDAFQKQQERKDAEFQARMEQEQAQAARRLAMAREEAKARISDIMTAFAEEQALRQEQRALQLERMKEDHNAQLAVMDTQQQERLAQIGRQEQEAAQVREQAWVTTFNQLATETGFAQDQLINVHRRGRSVISAELEAWYRQQASAAARALNTRRTSIIGQARDSAAAISEARRRGYRGGYQQPTFHSGGVVPGMGVVGANLLGGEGVLHRKSTAMIMRMLGGFDSGQIAGAVAAGVSGSGTSLNINMPVTLNDVGNRPLDDLTQAIRAGIYQAFEDTSRRRR